MSGNEKKASGERNNNRTLLIVLLVLVVAFVCALSGLAVGGVLGYSLGKKAVSPRLLPPEELPHERRVPIRPEIPPMPKMPEIPTVPWTYGALVREVVEGSPADEAGLREGDFITRVNGKQMEPGENLGDLVLEYEPGDVVRLTIIRGDQEKEIRVRLGRHPEKGRDVPYLGVNYTMNWYGWREGSPFHRD
mgnify:CR=1 FL=1